MALVQPADAGWSRAQRHAGVVGSHTCDVILAYIDVVTEATVAADAVDAGGTVSGAVGEGVPAIDLGDFAKDGPAEAQEMAAASDSDRAMEVAPEQDEFNSAADQMDAALATYAAITESA